MTSRHGLLIPQNAGMIPAQNGFFEAASQGDPR